MSQSTPKDLSPEAQLLRELHVQHEASLIEATPVEPVSAQAKARLIATFEKHGVQAPAAITQWPTQSPTAAQAALIALARGTAGSLRVAAAEARQWLTTLLKSAGTGAAMPVMRTNQESDMGLDPGTTHSGLATARSADEDDTNIAAQSQLTWTLMGLTRNRASPATLDVMITANRPAQSSTAIRVLGWTREAKERLLKSDSDVVIEAKDVHLLYEDVLSDKTRHSFSVSIPRGYRWEAEGSSTPALISRDDDGTLQVSLLIVPDTFAET